MVAFRFPYSNSTILGALLRNESGGRNIANVHQGTSSGQAQGYFQITTGTWRDFGGGKYAATPLGATYAQQAEIASKIPLRRWDKSTITAMRGTGRQVDPNRTLGENLAMHGEGFGNARALYQPHDVAATAPAAADPGAPPPPPAVNELTGADKAKPLSGLLGEMARSGGERMQPMELMRPSAGPGGASLSDIIQQYLALQRRSQQPQPISPQGQ